MAGETKIEDESDHQTPTQHQYFPTTPESIPNPNHALKPNKSKSHSKEKDSPASASAKRRCVSTACIACRRRKSKVAFLPNILYSLPYRSGLRLTNDFNEPV